MAMLYMKYEPSTLSPLPDWGRVFLRRLRALWHTVLKGRHGAPEEVPLVPLTTHRNKPKSD